MYLHCIATNGYTSYEFKKTKTKTQNTKVNREILCIAILKDLRKEVIYTYTAVDSVRVYCKESFRFYVRQEK